jgi:hypothetical protein
MPGKNMRSIFAVLGALCCAAAAAPTAGAATFYVDDSGSGGACSEAQPCATVGTAVSLARTAPSGPHRIEVGPGLYRESVELTNPLDSGLEINGSGSGTDPQSATVFRLGATPTYFVVVLGSPSGQSAEMELRHVRVEHPGSSSTPGQLRGAGVLVNARDSVLEDVHVELPALTTADPGIRIDGPGTVVDRAIVRAPGAALGLFSQADDPAREVDVTVRDSDIRGGSGGGLETRGDGGLLLQRSRVSGSPTAEAALSSGGALTADSSLITGGVNGLRYFGGAGIDGLLRGVTIDAGQPGVADPVVSGSEGEQGFAVSTGGSGVRLESSIALERLQGFGGTIRCESSTVRHQVEAADPVERRSSIECPSGPARPQGNLESSPGALFSDAAAEDWRLRPRSPAIDAGSATGLAAGESPGDLIGAARITDGDADGAARRDQGAFEAPAALRIPLVAPRDTQAPSITGARFVPAAFRVGPMEAPLMTTARRRAPRGSTLRLRLSEAATLSIAVQRARPGRRTTGRCRKAARRMRRGRRCTRWITLGVLARRSVPSGVTELPFSGRVGRKALSPGRYRAAIVAIDAGGNRSKRAASRFRILRQALTTGRRSGG